MAGRHYDRRRWKRLRALTIARTPYCEICHRMGRLTVGTDAQPLEVDHRVPLSRGGTDEASNLMVLCKNHHSSKTHAESRGRRWRPKGCDVNGSPFDLTSDWYKPARYQPYKGGKD